MKLGISESAPALYGKSDTPRRHMRTIDDAASPDAWVKVRDRLQVLIGSGFLVGLVGKRGPGKTQIAQQVILYACTAHRECLYVRAMDMIISFQTANSQLATETRTEAIERFCAPKLLVIDEFQVRGETPFEDRMLDHILDRRYGDMTDTIIIANLTRKAFAESVGSSILDRLNETGGITECTWPSFRQKPKEREKADA